MPTTAEEIHTAVFSHSVELVGNSGLPVSSLMEVGTDHRLADPEPLKAMLEACEGRV
jgi:hypothetical protein